MGMFSTTSKKGYPIVILKMVDGLNIPMNTMVKLEADDEAGKVKFTIPFIKKEPLTLAYEQIKNIEMFREDQIKEKEKSVLGRALIGGILIGPLGAIIGGISGTGTKKKKKNKLFVVINYVSKNDEIKVVSFEDTRMYFTNKFIQHMKGHIKTVEIDDSNEL